MSRIYLDHAATTPLAPEVREAMQPWLEREFGNPSSLHAEGRRAKDAIDEARETVSGALGSLFAEVLFTSSGTEAANLALVGAALNNRNPRRTRILIAAIEHHCVLHTQPILERLGYRVEHLPADRTGVVHPPEGSLEDVLLVSVMHANNELGTLQPVREIADRAHRAGALIHTDTVQTFLAPELDWRIKDLDADIATLSAHKINGPKGVGAIYLRAGVKLAPLAVGGGQEREMRAGTENVAGIVGFGAAVRRRTHSERGRGSLSARRDRFLAQLEAAGAVRTVPPAVPMLAGHAHVRFPGIDAETLLIRLDREGASASSGAACSSGSLEPSHVLLACGYSFDEAREGLRFSFGPSTTDAESVEAAKRVVAVVEAVRESRGRA